MKIALRLIPLLGFAIFAYIHWGKEGLGHLIFPSVPADVALSPKGPLASLDFEQSLIMLAAVIILSLLLFLWFKKTILPKISAGILNWLTGQDDCYEADTDELVQTLNKLNSNPTREDLAPLDALCEKNPTRLRNWTEYANLLRNHFHDTEGAIEVLKRASHAVNNKEDVALLLYRIAALYEQELHRPEEARKLYQELATNYPQCSYGKLAQGKH